MKHEKTAAPIPPVGAGGEQPQVKKTTDSIADIPQEIKFFQSDDQTHTMGGLSSGGLAQTCFLNRDSKLPAYIQYPRFLIGSSLNETAQLLYAVLLDRARLSIKKPEWTDDFGRVFIHYPISKLAEILHKSETTIKNALSDLERTNLILRHHQGIGKPNRIYVRIPTAGKLSAPETENCPQPGQNTVCHEGRILSGSKNNTVRTISKKEDSKSKRMAYGPYNNVFLTKEEYNSLYRKIRNLPACINHLSSYMHRREVTYSDHAATLLYWAGKDGNLIPERNYDCEEEQACDKHYGTNCKNVKTYRTTGIEK